MYDESVSLNIHDMSIFYLWHFRNKISLNVVLKQERFVASFYLRLLPRIPQYSISISMGTTTGYGPRSKLPIFDGNEEKYDLWEVKFLGYMRIQKLHEIITQEGALDADGESKNADAFAELVQCLDDRESQLSDEGCQRRWQRIVTNFTWTLSE